MIKPALLMAIGVLAVPMWTLYAQVAGPFELPERFRKHRFPQVHVADCSLPLGIEKQAPRPVKTYKVGGVTARLSKELRVEGKDTGGEPWALNIEIKSGGCSLWQADLDRNGREDLIVLTSDATSAGDSIATLIMMDDRNRPVPWQASGHYDGEDTGLSNLVDLDGDGRAELLFLYTEGIDRGKARSTSISRYEINNAHLRRVGGRFVVETFPIVQPKSAKVRREPDLTNSVDMQSPGTTIASLSPGRKENCGAQLPLTRSGEGALGVDRAASEALGQGCYGKLTLSDGRQVSLPELVVLDRANGREVAIQDTAHLLVEAKMRRLVIRLVGGLCDDACHPFFLWATEQPGSPGIRNAIDEVSHRRRR